MIKKKKLHKWTKMAMGVCIVLCAMLIISCTGRSTGKEAKKYLQIKIEQSENISFMDVNTNERLQYGKLIIFDKEIDRVFHAKVGGMASLGVGVSWKEVVPPKTEIEEFTRFIGHSELKKNMEYTLKAGVLTIDVP